MAVSVVVMAVSVFLPDGTRMIVWGAFVGSWMVLWVMIERWAQAGRDIAFTLTDSLIERFGLFTIIVLGEGVVGVVTGLSEVERNPEAAQPGGI
jgi:low temperature requirement protein LtrA